MSLLVCVIPENHALIDWFRFSYLFCHWTVILVTFFASVAVNITSVFTCVDEITDIYRLFSLSVIHIFCCFSHFLCKLYTACINAYIIFMASNKSIWENKCIHLCILMHSHYTDVEVIDEIKLKKNIFV